MFTATASTQYIHVAPGTLTYLYVRIYDSNGSTVGNSGNVFGYTRYASWSLISGQTYYIRVQNWAYSGTYQIAFSASIVIYGADYATLTESQWANGSIASSIDSIVPGVQLFMFTATASTQHIHVTFGTLEHLYVQIYDSSGGTVGDNAYLSGSTGYDRSASRSLTSGQTYYIGVSPPSNGYSGTYQIAFNASIVPPGTNATMLTESQWADGNIATSDVLQWFRFTATASTQYIHAAFGTLTALNVQIYDSSSDTVGAENALDNASRYASQSLTPGQTYYIRVVWYYGYIGTYQIAFNASSTAPAP
jgi:hypothetical protein